MCQGSLDFDFEAHAARIKDLRLMEPDPVPADGEHSKDDPDNRKNVMGRLGELKVCSVLTGAKTPHVDGLYLENGSRFIQIDHVALAGSAFVVIESKNWQLSNWNPTEVGDRKRRVEFRDKRLNSAICQNDVHVDALRSFLDRAYCVVGLVVLSTTYDKFISRPDDCIWIAALANKIKAIAMEHPADSTSSNAWERIMAQHRNEAYMSDARQKHREACKLSKEDPAKVAAWHKAREERLARAQLAETRARLAETMGWF